MRVKLQLDLSESRSITMALSDDCGRLRGTLRLGLESVSTSCETSPSTLAWRAALFFRSCLSMCDIDY